MKGVDILLADDGTFILELPWAKDRIEKNEFDTVYQGQLSEFSLLSLARLGAFFDMHVVDVTRLGVHGGSMRICLRRKAMNDTPAPVVQEMLDEELASGMLDKESYDAFTRRVDDVGTELRQMLKEMKAKGLKIAGYGAPAKGNTLLKYFGIGPSELDFLVRSEEHTSELKSLMRNSYAGC